jgi:hypothetical protein
MTEITTSGLKSVCCDPCVCENKLAIDLQGLESVFVARLQNDAGQQTTELKPGKERSFRRRRKPKEEKRGE